MNTYPNPLLNSRRINTYEKRGRGAPLLSLCQNWLISGGRSGTCPGSVGSSDISPSLSIGLQPPRNCSWFFTQTASLLPLSASAILLRLLLSHFEADVTGSGNTWSIRMHAVLGVGAAPVPTRSGAPTFKLSDLWASAPEELFVVSFGLGDA
jgi:hypothetical protein